jgi:hypothetical protein
MLFKSLPMSHRAALFLATLLTADPLLKWMHGTPFRTSNLVPIFAFWAIVLFQSLQRRNPNWQLGRADGFDQPSLMDVIGSRFDRLPVSIKFGYWLVVIIAAVIIYQVA